MKFFTRWKIWRAMMMAWMTTDRPGSVSTMSAAARAASVAPATAMPTSAFLSAGASLTPSPVMPTAKPTWRRHSTIRYCAGAEGGGGGAAVSELSAGWGQPPALRAAPCRPRLVQPLPSCRRRQQLGAAQARTLCSGYTWAKPSASTIILAYLGRSLGICGWVGRGAAGVDGWMGARMAGRSKRARRRRASAAAGAAGAAAPEQWRQSNRSRVAGGRGARTLPSSSSLGRPEASGMLVPRPRMRDISLAISTCSWVVDWSEVV